jgi:hypothetical protein
MFSFNLKLESAVSHNIKTCDITLSLISEGHSLQTFLSLLLRVRSLQNNIAQTNQHQRVNAFSEEITT